MASQTEIELALYSIAHFLEEQKSLARRGISLETVYSKVDEMKKVTDANSRRIGKLVTEQIGTNLRIDRVTNRVRRLERSSEGGDASPDPESSAQHRIEDLQRAQQFAALQGRIDDQDAELAAQRAKDEDETKWWQRQRWLWLGIFVAMLFSAGCSGCVGLVVWKVTSAQAAKGTK